MENNPRPRQPQYRQPEGQYRPSEGQYRPSEGQYRPSEGQYRQPMGQNRQPEGQYRQDLNFNPAGQRPRKRKRSTLSLIALILGILAVIIEIGTASSGMGSAANDAEQAGVALGLMIVLPSAASLFVAVILNLIGYLTRSRGLTLASAIVYIVAFVLFPLWGFVALPSMILQFVAFAKMKKPRRNFDN